MSGRISRQADLLTHKHYSLGPWTQSALTKLVPGLGLLERPATSEVEAGGVDLLPALAINRKVSTKTTRGFSGDHLWRGDLLLWQQGTASKCIIRMLCIGLGRCITDIMLSMRMLPLDETVRWSRAPCHHQAQSDAAANTAVSSEYIILLANEP